MNDQSDDDGGPPRIKLRELPHLREELPGKPEIGIESTTVEERGLQVLVRNNYKNPQITAAEFALNAPDNIALNISMVAHANRILRDAGWLDWPQVQEEIDRAVDAGLNLRTARLVMTSSWFSNIYKTNGMLSVQSMAAQYLMSWDGVMGLVDFDEEKLRTIADFTERAFWMQMELMDYHYFAVEGSKAVKGRATSPLVRSTKAEKKRKLTESAVVAYVEANPNLKSDGWATSKIVKGVFDSLNTQLRAAKLQEYADGSLRNAVNRIFKNIYKAK